MNFLTIRSFTDGQSNTHQALWAAMGSLSSLALGLVSAAILSRYFDKTEYGTYRQILYVYYTLLVIFSAGLPQVFAYFLPRYPLSQGKDIVLKVSSLLLTTGLAFSIFLFAFSSTIASILKNPELSKGLKLFSPIPMLLLPTLGIEGIFSTYKKTIFIAIYNTLTRVLMLIFIVLPVIIFNGTYLHAIYGWIIVSIITLVAAYYFKNIPFKGISVEASVLSNKEIFKYCFPIGLASIAGIAIKAADQFYISRYFGTEVFADFSNGFIELPFVGMITGASATVLMPMFSKMIYNKSDINQLVNLWQSALQKSVMIIYPIVIFFLFFSKDIMIILYSNTYSISSQYFSTALIINFFNVIIFGPLLFSLGETRFYARLHYGLAISSWVFGYLIVIIFKTPLSIAVFSVFLSIMKIIISLGYSSRIIGVKFFTLFPVNKFLIVALHSFVSLSIMNLLIKYSLPQLGSVLLILITGLGYLILLLLSSRLFKIDYWNIILPLFPKKNS